jgi:DNA-binding MarR family transcriptional regulator
MLVLWQRRGLAATELRMLLALLDRDASLSELAEVLGERPIEIRRAGRTLSARGLVRWCHVGRRKETRVELTAAGLATIRPMLRAVDLRVLGDHSTQPADYTSHPARFGH